MASCGVSEVAAEETWFGTTREVRKRHPRGGAAPASVPDEWGMARKACGPQQPSPGEESWCGGQSSSAPLPPSTASARKRSVRSLPRHS